MTDQAAPWRAHVQPDEAERLEVIEDRLTRKQATVDELVKERHRIMRRAIMRMRRARNTD